MATLFSIRTILATEELLNSVSGYYACNDTFMRVQKQSGTLNVAYYNTNSNDWEDMIDGLRLRDDDRFASDSDPSQSVSFKAADGRQYLVIRSVGGYGHYQDDLIYAQQVAAAGPLPAAWSGRLGKKWLMTNEHPEYSLRWASPVM
jgi:hypothetical protein